MSQPKTFWGEPSLPGDVTLLQVFQDLIQMALTDGSLEIQRAGGDTGVLRLNLALTVRHGRPQGSSSSLAFEKKTGL